MDCNILTEQGILPSAGPIDGCMNQSAYNYMIEAETQSDEVYCTVAAELVLAVDKFLGLNLGQ